MKILYNPTDGAPITSFIFNGRLIDSHLPDGQNSSNGLMQYEDDVAEEIMETYQFLRELTKEQAVEMIENPPEPQYKCDFPGCDFSTRVKVALSSHSRKHAKEIGKREATIIDADKIPVAGGKQVSTLADRQKMLDNDEDATRNGADKDGVEWYGEGAVKENKGFDAMRKPGSGHF